MAYASANAWLDALAVVETRIGSTRNHNQLGPVVGRRHEPLADVQRLDPITPAEGIEALESLVGGNLTRVGVARLRLDRAVAATPEFRELGYFEKLVEEFDTASADNRSIVADGNRALAPVPDWSQIPAENRISELEIRLRPSWPANFECRHRRSTSTGRSPSWDWTR